MKSKLAKILIATTVGLAIGLLSHLLPWVILSYGIFIVILCIGLLGILGAIHIFRPLKFFPSFALIFSIILFVGFFSGIIQTGLLARRKYSKENALIDQVEIFRSENRHLPSSISEFDTEGKFNDFDFSVDPDSIHYTIAYAQKASDGSVIRYYKSAEHRWQMTHN